MHEDVRSLIKCGAHHLVPAPAYMTIIVDLSGTVATWRQAEVSAYVSRASDPLSHIDAGPICKCHNYTHTGDCHEAATYGIIASHLDRHAIKMKELLQEHTAHT